MNAREHASNKTIPLTKWEGSVERETARMLREMHAFSLNQKSNSYLEPLCAELKRAKCQNFAVRVFSKIPETNFDFTLAHARFSTPSFIRPIHNDIIHTYGKCTSVNTCPANSIDIHARQNTRLIHWPLLRQNALHRAYRQQHENNLMRLSDSIFNNSRRPKNRTETALQEWQQKEWLNAILDAISPQFRQANSTFNSDKRGIPIEQNAAMRSLLEQSFKEEIGMKQELNSDWCVREMVKEANDAGPPATVQQTDVTERSAAAHKCYVLHSMDFGRVTTLRQRLVAMRTSGQVWYPFTTKQPIRILNRYVEQKNIRSVLHHRTSDEDSEIRFNKNKNNSDSRKAQDNLAISWMPSGVLNCATPGIRNNVRHLSVRGISPLEFRTNSEDQLATIALLQARLKSSLHPGNVITVTAFRNQEPKITIQMLHNRPFREGLEMKLELSQEWYERELLKDEMNPAPSVTAGQADTINLLTLDTYCNVIPFSYNDTNTFALSRFVTFARRAKGWNIEMLAIKAEINLEEALLLEHEDITHVAPRTITQVAKVLDLPVKKLMALAGLVPLDDRNFKAATLQFAARSESVTKLTDSERIAYEDFIKILKEG